MADSPRLRQLQEFLADSPDDPELRYAVAMELLSLGADDDAVRSFRDLIAAHAGLRSRLPDARPDVDPPEPRRRREGRAARRRRRGPKAGNAHAEGEIQGLTDGLE